MAKVNKHTHRNALMQSVVNWLDDNGYTINGSGGVWRLHKEFCAKHKLNSEERKMVSGIIKQLADEERG